MLNEAAISVTDLPLARAIGRENATGQWADLSELRRHR